MRTLRGPCVRALDAEGRWDSLATFYGRWEGRGCQRRGMVVLLGSSLCRIESVSSRCRGERTAGATRRGMRWALGPRPWRTGTSTKAAVLADILVERPPFVINA